MSATTTYNIRIDKQVREQADALYKNMGLSLSSAINVFLKQSIIQGKLPINEIIAEPVYGNALLRDADEVDTAVLNKTAIMYTTPATLFAEWEKEDAKV
jgi:DNA-damage-inducible protein J